MQIIVTTVLRGGRPGDHGRVYVLDWDSGRVVQRIDPPKPRTFNDRSGGYRGVAFLGDLCYIAGADSLFGYTPDWELSNIISNPLFGDLHEIESTDRTLWVTSPEVDALLEVDETGQILSDEFLGELPEEDRQALGLEARIVDRGIDYRTTNLPTYMRVARPNGLCRWQDGLYVSLYHKGAVIGINPFRVVWQRGDFMGLHSPRFIDGGRKLLLAASFQQSLVCINPDNGVIEAEVPLLPGPSVAPSWPRLQKFRFDRWSQNSKIGRRLAWIHRGATRRWRRPSARPGWARGIAILDPERVLIGTSPAGILLVDLRKRTVERRLQIAERVEEAVFSVAIDPRR